MSVLGVIFQLNESRNDDGSKSPKPKESMMVASKASRAIIEGSADLVSLAAHDIKKSYPVIPEGAAKYQLCFSDPV